MNNEVMSTKNLAEMLGLQPQTLRIWRSQGRGPQYIRFGGSKSRVFYRKIDVEVWFKRNTYANTSEETVLRSGLSH